MTMMRARVLTPWVGSGTEADPYRPQLADAYGLRSYGDVTGQPAASLVPNPNLYTAEVVCTDTVLAQIDADPNYCVLWSETT